MAQTYRDRSPYELALAVRTVHDNGVHERVQEGDIVAARKPFGHGEVGRAERAPFLWLRVEGHQLGDVYLNQRLYVDEVRYDKRRYSIPFRRLQQQYPWLDLSRVRDMTDPYQPFMGGLDREQEYTPLTVSEAQAVLVSEGLTPAQADATLEPVMEVLRRRRLGRPNRLDDHKLPNALIFRLPDGTFVLNVGGRQTGGHFLAPRTPLRVEGLVFDKSRMRYL